MINIKRFALVQFRQNSLGLQPALGNKEEDDEFRQYK